MREQEPSRTAFAAAAHRAAHQVLENGCIFTDGLALTILGQSAAEIVRDAESDPARRGMRYFIAARAKFAETALATAVHERGVQQLVVLGAGLDTFAYRNPMAGRLRVFEIDHPATQAWKHRRLAEIGIAIPPDLRYAPVDFERDDFLQSLQHVGFDPAQRSFFIWLGVVPYLTKEAVLATLAAIGTLPGGAHVVFDYSDPPGTLPPRLRASHEIRAARVAAIGEPFLSYFEPNDLHHDLRRLGLTEIDDLGPPDLARRYVADLLDAAAASRFNEPGADRGGHVILAATR